jgi:signal transduction histidine kinase
MRSSRVRNGSARVWALNGVLIAAAVAVVAGPLRAVRPFHTGLGVSWLIVAAGFAAAEAFVVHLPFRHESESFSLSEIPLVVGLFYVSPIGLVAAQVIGAGLALGLKRRQPAIKLVFNLGHMALEAGVAVLVFRSIATPGLSSFAVTATFAATLVTIAIGVCAVVLAISLSEGEFRVEMFRRVLGLGWIVSMTNTSLGLLGVEVLRTNPSLGWLLAVPATTLFFAYRAYTSETQKRRGMEMMYESTRALQGSLDVEQTIASLLGQSRAMFRAEIAWVNIFPDTLTEPVQRFIMGGDEEISMQEIVLDPRDGLWARVASEGVAMLQARPIRDEKLRAYYAQFDLRDLMIAPLFAEDRVVGTVLVGNRLSDVNTFDADDLRLFETLVNHAGVALVNARLVSKLEEALEREVESNRLKDDFVAMISHELRTPLTSISGFVKTLLRPDVVPDTTQRQHCLEVIDRQSERLKVMIEDLLLVSQIEADRVHAQWSRVSPARIAEQVVDELTPRARGRQLRLQMDAPPAIVSDEEMIHRVLSNLVENAIKYSPEDTTVTVSAEMREGNLVLSVRDQGIGIPAEAREHIFDRFYQVDQSKTRRVGGAGLGLFISRKLARSIGGDLWLERTGDHGSEFCLRVPATPSIPGAAVEKDVAAVAS